MWRLAWDWLEVWDCILLCFVIFLYSTVGVECKVSAVFFGLRMTGCTLGNSTVEGRIIGRAYWVPSGTQSFPKWGGEYTGWTISYPTWFTNPLQLLEVNGQGLTRSSVAYQCWTVDKAHWAGLQLMPQSVSQLPSFLKSLGRALPCSEQHTKASWLHEVRCAGLQLTPHSSLK